MRTRILLVVGLVFAIYVSLAFLVLVTVPEVVVSGDNYRDISDVAARQQAITTERASVRAGGVALLAGSTLGAAGIVAVLTYAGARKDADHLRRKSDDELFMKAIDVVADLDSPGVVGAIAVMGETAARQRHLRGGATDLAFQVVRQQCRMNSQIAPTAGNRACADFADRHPSALAALRLIGELSPVVHRQMGASVILDRQLDRCDFRRLRIGNLKFEVLSLVGSMGWDSVIADCEFFKCTLGQLDWLGARLTRVTFRECDLTGSDFSAAQLTEVTFERCIGAPST